VVLSPVPPWQSHARHLVLQRLLEQVKVGAMPGQKELAVVGAGDRQGQAVDPGPVLKAAIVVYRLSRSDRPAEVSELAGSEATGASTVPEPLRSLARRGADGWTQGAVFLLRARAERFPPRRVRRRQEMPATPPVAATTGAKLSRDSSTGIPAMWANTRPNLSHRGLKDNAARSINELSVPPRKANAASAENELGAIASSYRRSIRHPRSAIASFGSP